MTIERLIERAIRTGNVRDGCVICENCDTPASKSCSIACGWAGCAPCMYGEADSFDAGDLIKAVIYLANGEIMTSNLQVEEPEIYRCPHEKNVGRSSMCYPAHHCDLNEGHEGKHVCDCGWVWQKSSNAAWVEE